MAGNATPPSGPQAVAAAQTGREGRALWFGALVVLVLSLAAARVLWRSREDALQTWEQTLGNFSATMAEHAGQSFRTVDFVLRRLVDRIEAAHVVAEDELQRVFGTRQTHTWRASAPAKRRTSTSS